MTLTAIFLLSLSLSLQDAPAQEGAESGEQAAPTAKPEKLICRHQRTRGNPGERVGARIPTRKVCKTKTEWEAERAD